MSEKISKNIYLNILFLIFLTSFKVSAAQISFPAPASFGNVEIGSSKSLTFTVKNNGPKNIRFDSYWFQSNLSYKLIGGTCQFNNAVLKIGKTCTISISFNSTAIGLQAGQIVLGYFLGTGWVWGENSLNLNGAGVEKNPIPIPTPIPTPTPIPSPIPTGWPKVIGNQILDSQNKPLILKGVNIADPQQLDNKTWERPNTNARSIASLASDQYFSKVIRLPILPGNATYPNEGFLSLTTGKDVYFNNHILPLVNELTSKGIYVIIDLHYVSDYANLYGKVAEFWTYMAPKFKDNPYVIYEIFNEPINPNDWATWKNTIAQPATNLIRSLAPNNLIFIGGPNWSSNMAGAASNPISGNNLVYIAHVYSNQTPAMWDSRYSALADKYPLFFTEWGFETGGTEGGDINFGIQFESWMRLHNSGWTAWSFDTIWGPRMFNSDWSIKDSPGGQGIFIRDLLIENNLKIKLQ